MEYTTLTRFTEGAITYTTRLGVMIFLNELFGSRTNLNPCRNFHRSSIDLNGDFTVADDLTEKRDIPVSYFRSCEPRMILSVSSNFVSSINLTRRIRDPFKKEISVELSTRLRVEENGATPTASHWSMNKLRAIFHCAGI